MARPNIFVRMWRYMTAALTGRFEEIADPKVQLEQAIGEARDNHQKLREQAANVIANQKQTDLRLERVFGELEKLTSNAQQALLMAEEARTSGRDEKAAEYEAAAESIATKLVTVEQEVEDLKALALEAARASQQAKDAVAQNSAVLQQRLAEKQKLLGQLDQAKMAEQMNDAMSSLNETVGQDAPSFEEVRQKIEARVARAQAAGELAETGVESRILEVEQASRNVEAQKRLSELRSSLGIGSTAAPAEEAAPTPSELAGEPISVPPAAPPDHQPEAPDDERPAPGGATA
jgi:phage shock protein A